jgi:hypothetical protein
MSEQSKRVTYNGIDLGPLPVVDTTPQPMRYQFEDEIERLRAENARLRAEVERLERVEAAARAAANACTPKCWTCGAPAPTQARNACYEHFCDACWTVAKDKKTGRLEPYYDNAGPLGPCDEVRALVAALEAR